MASIDVYVAQALRDVGIPIDGVSIGRVEDKATWRVDFTPAATESQKAQAASIIGAFTEPTPAQLADDEAKRETERKELRAVAMGLWECIPTPTMTKAQLAARIKAIYKSL